MTTNMRRAGMLGLLVLTCGAADASTHGTTHDKTRQKTARTAGRAHSRKASASPAGASSPAAPAASPLPLQARPAEGESNPAVVFVVGGPPAEGFYHRALCPSLRVNGAILTSYSLAEAQKRHFQPHCLCVVGRDEPPPCSGSPAEPPR